MNEIVEQTKADFNNAKERIVKALATTPDDKINWSPRSTARTPVQLVAHAAMGNTLVLNLLTEKPFPYGSAAEYDASARQSEKEYTTREQALSLLEKTSTQYLAWLDTLTQAQLDTTVNTFFGPAEIKSSIKTAADHIRNHAAQIDYLQTTWEDTDWHL